MLCACSNAILLCDGKGCRTAVHQACYGVGAVPEGEWLCDGCAARLDPRGAHCLLCPVAGGALRPVASLGAVRPPDGACDLLQFSPVMLVEIQVFWDPLAQGLLGV